MIKLEAHPGRDPSSARAPVIDQAVFEGAVANRISVAQSLRSPHPLVRRAADLLSTSSARDLEYLYNGRERHLDIQVARKSLSRALTAPMYYRLTDLAGHGYEVVDLSGDEVAKLHVRYMVGGPGPGLQDELLYRFEFPERPGALRDFLEALAHGWNISLFHYRNHGADHGRVLAGIQVPPAERETFAGALSVLGYPHWPETGNPAYRMFLGG